MLKLAPNATPTAQFADDDDCPVLVGYLSNNDDGTDVDCAYLAIPSTEAQQIVDTRFEPAPTGWAIAPLDLATVERLIVELPRLANAMRVAGCTTLFDLANFDRIDTE